MKKIHARCITSLSDLLSWFQNGNNSGGEPAASEASNAEKHAPEDPAVAAAEQERLLLVHALRQIGMLLSYLTPPMRNFQFLSLLLSRGTTLHAYIQRTTWEIVLYWIFGFFGLYWV